MRNRRWHFDVFEFDPQTLELFRAGEPVHLQRQPALVLLMLLEQEGGLVTRRDLQARIWGDDRNVDVDRSVAYCLRQVRTALGDDAASAKYVETLRGVGYRFVGRLTPVATTAPAARPRNLARTAAAVCLLAIVAVMLGDRFVRRDAAVTITPAIDLDTIVRRADAYRDRRDADDMTTALTMYERVLAESPSHVPALAGAARATASLALHHREVRRGLAALHYASLAVQLAPRDPGALAARAQGLHAAGHFEDAERAYAVALALPHAPQLTDDHALLLYQRGRIDDALRVLVGRWHTSEPDSEPAALIGTALGALGFAKESREWSELALRLSPDVGQSRYLEGLKAFHGGRLGEARAWITPLLETRDPGTLVVALASQLDAREHGPAAALPRLIAAVEVAPEAYEIRATLAHVYRATGQADHATRERARTIRTCRDGASSAPQSPFWPRCLASQLAEAGSLDEAAEWYERAVDLGWRKPTVDRNDRSLALLSTTPRFIAAQKRARTDLDRMRTAVEREGVPVAPAVR